MTSDEAETPDPEEQEIIDEALRLLEEIDRENRYTTDPRSGKKQAGPVGDVVAADETPEDHLSRFTDDHPEDTSEDGG